MLLAGLWGGCGEEQVGEAPGTELAVQQDELATVGVERVIPVRFIVLDDFASPCSTQLTAADAFGALREANDVFRPAGIQFSMDRFDRYNTPQFRNLGQFTTVPWANVWAELQPIEPALITSTLFTGSDYTDFWASRLAEKLPRNTLQVFVPCSDSWPGSGSTSHASWPTDPPEHAYRVHVLATHMGHPASGVSSAHTQATLAHELGHFFGLPHSFDEWSNDAYDMFYGLESNGAVRFFNSASELSSWDPYSTRRIRKDSNSNCSGGTCLSNCEVYDYSTCEMKCTFGPNVYRSSTHWSELSGVSIWLQGEGRYGVNVMNYFYTFFSPAVCMTGLSPSQAQRVQSVIRQTNGRRNQLGRGARRLGPLGSPTLDFDGDGERDVATFRAWDGTCRVLRSSDGVTQVFTLSGVTASTGAIPVPGDYDGDGRTDCAAYLPGVGTSPAQWRWVASATGAAGSSTFGETGDLPISDVRIKTSSGGVARYAVFRPRTGQFWFWDSPTVARWVTFGTRAGDEPVLADYDRDGFTDLAVWRPSLDGTSTQAAFAASYSMNGYASYVEYNFGLSTDVALGPVRADTTATLDFAVFRPSNGTWYYLRNPTLSGNSGVSSQQWGLAGDVPVPGWDFDLDGRDDEIVFRPAMPVSTLWLRKSAGGSFGWNAGLGGDRPFFAPDRNGDGRPEFWLYRPSGYPEADYFELLSASTGYPTYTPIAFGAYRDVPL